jgi:hypothetical protein
MIHLGTHVHLVVKGKCRNVLEQVKFLVQEEVFHSLSTISSIISLVVSKFFPVQTLVQRGWLRAR